MENLYDQILNSDHEEEEEEEESPFMFSGFPTTTTTSPNKPLIQNNNITDDHEAELPYNSESIKKKRTSVNGKKDRHSKIRTAQGLRDRRMRLSLDIARKFFRLQDLLGFDKPSQTIDWLFSKSDQAIQEAAVALHHPLQQLLIPNNDNDQSIISTEENYSNKRPRGINSKKKIPNYNPSTIRDQARARARDRTRDQRLVMIKQVEKSSKELLLIGPKSDEIYKLGLRKYLATPNNNIHNNKEELGFATNYLSASPSDHPMLQECYSSSPSTVLDEPATIIAAAAAEVNNSFENYSAGSSSSTINHVQAASTSSLSMSPHSAAAAAGWLINSSSCNVGLLGMQQRHPADWETADRFIADYCCNSGIEPPTSSSGAAVADPPALTCDDIYELIYNPSSFSMSSTTTTNNILHYF